MYIHVKCLLARESHDLTLYLETEYNIATAIIYINNKMVHHQGQSLKVCIWLLSETSKYQCTRTSGGLSAYNHLGFNIM